MVDNRYPVGQFQKPVTITTELISDWITVIASFPEKLVDIIRYFSDEKLDTPYREDGWTVRQVVHHCADSHMNAFGRFKLALTEDYPVIKPYKEDQWAELMDYRMPVGVSISILTGLHQRWAVLLDSLSANDMRKGYLHPEHGRRIDLDEAIGMYAWHCRHHLAHITTLKSEKDW